MKDADFPQPTPEERELSRKVVELAALEEVLAGRERALTTRKAELHVFQLHYLESVGAKYADLDAVEAEIAEVEAGRDPLNSELRERAEAARARAQESADALEARRPPTRRDGPPPESLKKLFRKVARVIHPDLAEDEEARARRQMLMSAANLAYVTGNEEQLALILTEWEESPEAVAGKDAASELLRAIRQIAWVEQRIESLDQEIRALEESDLGRLQAQVEAGERAGRDLLGEMAAAVELQIEQAAARLEALRRREGIP